MESISIPTRIREIAARLSDQLAAIDRQMAAANDPDLLYPRVAAALDDGLASLAKLNIWGPENRLPSSEIWNAAGQWLARGWLQNQARAKPRGYAGDYAMLARIYENTLCDDPLGRLFDRYFQSQAAPQAVRNRMRMISRWIGEALTSKAPTKISIVGSAFGLELHAALHNADAAARDSVTATLLDLDPAALEFARQQLQPLLKPSQLVLQAANLFRLSERPSLAAPLADSQLIFCAGLFDYLDDNAAIDMIRCLFGQLALGGRLFIFQFAPHNPTRAYMEWLGNWYLAYRDQNAFEQLFAAVQLPDAAIEFATEPLGIDLYAKVRRRK